MPAGPEPMTATLPAGLRLDLEREGRIDAVVEHRLDDLVAGVAMAVADGDGLVDLVAAAMVLAGCRADAAEDGREGDRPLEDPGRFAPVALGVLLQEARDVDVARALVLAGRQAVGVVVQKISSRFVRRRRRTSSVWVWTFMPSSHGARAADRRVLLALDLDDAHPARAEAGQLRLVAERRDLDAVVAADLEDRLALEALDDASVDLDADARRRLRALGRLRGQEALGHRVLDRHDRVEDCRRVRA